jgi:uridine nucleosidase
MSSAHAAQIVLNAPVKKTMIPLNVTHQAIVTNQIHARILGGGEVMSNTTLPRASSNFRHTLSTIIAHFTESYKAVFGFNDGPPLHDALTLGYVSRPSLFSCKRHRVDIELTGQHSLGETVVDIWHYRSCDNSWGATGKNCLVAGSIDVRSHPPYN